MPIIDLPTEPRPLERRLFGLVVLLFCGLVGWLLASKVGSTAAAWVAWGVGLFVAAVYYAIPPLQNRIYRGWLLAFYPLGFVISHIVLGVIWYLLFTPIALLRRLFRRDPLARRRDPDAETYWVDRDGPVKHSRYFEQW